MRFLRALTIMAGIIFPAAAQTGTEKGEWRFYAGDDHSTKYSPLDQINASNARQLQIAWSWKGDNFSPHPENSSEVTPLMVGGVLYFTHGSTRVTVAVDAATGETLWFYRFPEDPARGVVRPNNRGVAYWTDGRGDQRILVITPGYELLALNAKTGRPIENFGTKGTVDLFKGLDRDVVEPGTIGSTSPAIVVKDTVVVGASLLLGVAPKSKENVPGYVRGYDVHTGKLLWTFRTIPHPGEFGNNTWLNNSWQYTGNTGVWAPMSADEELGYVYLPVEMPTGDHYGGDRPGDNLFSDSLVCLDARTGKRIWHFQLIHHDVWDWDIPAAPVLLDITVNGRKIKAVAQITKQAFTYVFDRVTGQPVWPIVERPVPQSDVPGEKSSPTQPFPTKPAAFDRQGITLDDLIDFTPELKAEAVKIASQYRIGPLFTPPSVLDAGGKKGSLLLPHATGGGNWQGAAADPETGILYVPSATNPYVAAMVHDPKRSDMEYISAGGQVERVMGLPLVKPPYGRITAIDLNTGDHVWMVPNGEPADSIRNNPVLKAAGVDTSKFGNGDRAPLLVTKSLLFAGDGTAGQNFRALDKKTGATIAEIKLPGTQTGMPMTYMAKGRQFIVIAVGGRDPAQLVALALPQPGAGGGRGGRGGRGGGGRGGPPPPGN